MNILVTGAAGFIGGRTASLLLEEGHKVVALDNLNSYYDIRLKVYRLADLVRQAGQDPARYDGLNPMEANPEEYGGPEYVDAEDLMFHKLDIENKEALRVLFRQHQFDAVVNLAARAGVRYSMVNPDVYMRTNAMGT
ncbi:MAG: GDP-mannose 4,6-dehydratase, partial [Planctomycetota bacterium]